MIEPQLARVLGAVDVEALRETYRRQNEFVHVERLFPPALVEAWVAEVEAARPHVHRSYIPRHKKGGSVSAHVLGRQAPAIVALYRSPALRAFLEAITGERLLPCPATDPHAFALYFYTEPGDHIGFHYDTSYYRGRRYTILVGMIERSSSRLVCDPYRRLRGHPPATISIRTEPGTLVLFNGDRLWHAITPLDEGEERVSLTLEYVTDPTMPPLRRFVSDMKDAIAYFGFRAVFRRTAQAASRASQ